VDFGKEAVASNTFTNKRISRQQLSPKLCTEEKFRRGTSTVASVVNSVRQTTAAVVVTLNVNRMGVKRRVARVSWRYRLDETLVLLLY